MPRFSALFLLPLALAIGALPATAAPMPRDVTLRLTAHVPFALYPWQLEASATATVSVDPAAQSLSIPPDPFGAVSDSVVVPVSGQTAIQGLSVTNLDLAGGVLAVGGVAAQRPGEICPPVLLPATRDHACNVGHSFGGPVGLVGTLSVTLDIASLVVPIPLAPRVGNGGSTNVPFSIDGAAWTLGRGHLVTRDNSGGSGTFATMGTLDLPASRFSLVTPSNIQFLGYRVEPTLKRPWRLEIAFTDGLGIPQFIVDAYDRDGDLVANWNDNCPDVPNAGQGDADGDGAGDACEAECQDGLDNDGDGAIDGADTACVWAGFDDEDPPCADGVDNDGDGAIDFPADPGCGAITWPAEDPACDNGLDDDGDGATDFAADAGCSAASAFTEAPDCSDGADNDGDGAIDHPADPGCKNAAGATEAPHCNDGVNNDGGQDSLIDFDGGAAAGLPPEQQTAPDPQCKGVGWGPTEIQEPGCGLGGEIALPLLALAALRRRRSAR